MTLSWRARSLAPDRSGRLAWSLWGLAVALTAAGIAFLVLNRAFPTVGVIVATRWPGNAIGWLREGAR